MSDSKFILTFATIIAALVCVIKFGGQKQIKENWGWTMTPMQAKVERVYLKPGIGLEGLPGNYQTALKRRPEQGVGRGDIYMIPGTYQSQLSPRNSGQVDYGAHLRYNMPDRKWQGVDTRNPLRPMVPPVPPALAQAQQLEAAQKQSQLFPGETVLQEPYGARASAYGGIHGGVQAVEEGYGCGMGAVEEGYGMTRGFNPNQGHNTASTVESYCGSCGGGYGCRGCGAVGCRKGGGGPPAHPLSAPATTKLMTADYAAPSFKQSVSEHETTPTTSLLPVGDMTMMNSFGEIEQPIVYDQLIFAQQRSRLYGQGDPIRGDLPIIPCKNEWFRPSVHPQIDLRDGAMFVMGGVDNGTTKELVELQNAAVGGVSNAFSTASGVNFAIEKSSYLTSGADLEVETGQFAEVTAFP